MIPIKVRHYGRSGPHVVLLHGGPGAPGEMVPVARYLSRQFRVLEPLQRGSGGVPLSVALHVADLHEVLRDFPRQGPVCLVGYSWGAMLALTYASRHPADLGRLILIGCGTFDTESREAYESSIQQRMDPATRNWVNEIHFHLAKEKDRQVRDKLLAELGGLYSRLQSVDPVEDPSEEEIACDEGAFRETWEDVLSLQERGIQPVEFARIEVPVTMLHGDSDPHPGPMIHKSLAPFIPQLEYRGIPQCGHKPWVERRARDDFFEMLVECLTGEKKAGRGFP